MQVAANLYSSMLSQSGIAANLYYPNAIVDGSTACCGWGTDTSVAGTWLQVDAHAATAFLGADIYASSAGYAGTYSVQYSDDAASWNTVQTGFTPGAQGWNTTTWPNAGTHRYWRLLLTNTPGYGPWLNELRLHAAANLNTRMLNESGISPYNAAPAVDGSTACCGWGTDTSIPGAWMQLDTEAN